MNPAAPAPGEDALLLEMQQRLAHRGAGDVDLLRDPVLHDALTGPKVACEYGIEHLTVHLVGQTRPGRFD